MAASASAFRPASAERVHQGKLRGLQLRVERDRLAQQADGLVDAAGLQERTAQLLVALGVLRQFDEGAPQQRLRLGATALAVERRAEERGQVRLPRILRERVAAELLRHRAVAGAHERECALVGGADQPGVGHRRMIAGRPGALRRRRRSAR